MNTYTIKQKMSNTGNIYDLASSISDRIIKFASGTKYAVILAAYYGGKGYTTHRTVEAAIAKSKSLRDYSHGIIDRDGNEYGVNCDTLRRV